MRSIRALPVTFAIATVLVAGSALADGPTVPTQFSPTTAAQVVSVASGMAVGRLDGDTRLRYPGYEQTTVVNTPDNHIVMITMEAVQEPNLGPVQCSCTSYLMHPDGPPTVDVPMTRLTALGNGERTCNHPKAVSDENGNIVWGYGSDTGSNRPNTYAGIINAKCQHLAAPQMVNVARDANDGAFDIAYLGGGKFVAGYYSDGGGGAGAFPAAGGQYTVTMGLTLNNTGLLPTLTRTWIMGTITPTDIGRPTIASVGPDRALVCAPQGPNRPSDNIACALVDGNTGTTVWQDNVAKGNRGMYSYFNQPTVKRIDDTHYALMAIESSGQGKQGQNVKGSNLSHLFMLERNGDAMTVASEATGVAAHQTHASICTGAYGVDGAPSVSVFSAAPTGIGRAEMVMVGYDMNAKQFSWDPVQDLWPAAWYGDSGYLSNMYGRNPMRQGRDFLRCIGDVPNLGYHVQGGFMPDVKSLFVGAVHGRVPGDAKNSLFLAVVPGQMDTKVTPGNPVPAGVTPTIGDQGQTNAPAAPGPNSSGGCGCSTPGTHDMNGAAALAAAAALGLVVARRRRNR